MSVNDIRALDVALVKGPGPESIAAPESIGGTQVGDEVEQGQKLFVLEAMKARHQLSSCSLPLLMTEGTAELTGDHASS